VKESLERTIKKLIEKESEMIRMKFKVLGILESFAKRQVIALETLFPSCNTD